MSDSELFIAWRTFGIMETGMYSPVPQIERDFDSEFGSWMFATVQGMLWLD